MRLALAAFGVLAGCAAIAGLEDPTPEEIAPLDGGDEVVDAGAGDANEGGADLDVDAGPKCRSATVADSLTVLDGGGLGWIVIHDGSNTPYPIIEDSGEGPAVTLVTPNGTFNLGAIYLPKAIAIHAFDVTFRYLMDCPAADAAADAGRGCSDGIAVVWLEAADVADASILQTYTSAATFGVPAGVKGGGVVFDMHEDPTIGDPVPPAVSTLAIDGIRMPGQYDWHTKSAPFAGMVGAHDVTLRLRSGVLSVDVDKKPVVDGPVIYGIPAWFGIASSQGAETGSFIVRSFAGTFYECDEP